MAPSAVDIPAVIPKAFSTPTTTNGHVKNRDLKGPDSPLPEVKIFDAASCSVEELVAALRVAGGVVVRGVLNKDELADLEKDTRPWLEKDNAWGDGGGEGKFLPLIACLLHLREEEVEMHHVLPLWRVHNG